MKKDNALSMSECFRLCAEMRISLMELIVSRNCVGVSLRCVSASTARIEDKGHTRPSNSRGYTVESCGSSPAE